jgi:hypothetical protein
MSEDGPYAYHHQEANHTQEGETDATSDASCRPEIELDEKIRVPFS